MLTRSLIPTDNVAKVTIFLTDMSNFGDVVDLRRKYFSEPYPADSIVEVESLYTPEGLIDRRSSRCGDRGAS